MTSSDAMIAITADLATVLPKVGPIDSVSGVLAKPYAFSSESRTLFSSLGLSVSVEIWKALLPSSLFVTRWI